MDTINGTNVKTLVQKNDWRGSVTFRIRFLHFRYILFLSKELNFQTILGVSNFITFSTQSNLNSDALQLKCRCIQIFVYQVMTKFNSFSSISHWLIYDLVTNKMIRILNLNMLHLNFDWIENAVNFEFFALSITWFTFSNTNRPKISTPVMNWYESKVLNLVSRCFFKYSF